MLNFFKNIIDFFIVQSTDHLALIFSHLNSVYSNWIYIRIINSIFFYSSSSKNDDPTILSLHRMKKIFAAVIFSSTAGLTLYLFNKKQNKLNELLHDCQKLDLNKSLFKANVTLFK